MRRRIKNGKTVHIYDDREGEPGQLWRTVDNEEEIQEVIEALPFRK